MRWVTAICLLGVLGGGTVARADRMSEAEEEMRKAKMALDRHEYEGAIGHYLVARSLAPETSGPYLGLGLAYGALGRCPDAIPVLEEYLRRKKVDPHPGAMSTLEACRAGRDPSVAPPPVAPPPASSRRNGRVHVGSEPPGALVSLDDDESDVRGRTPIELTLPPGGHTVTLTAPGYRAETRPLNVVGGQATSLQVTMQLVLPTIQSLPRGRLRIESEPAARYTLNGMPIPGERTQYDAEVSPGSQFVVVEESGYESISREVFVPDGRNVSSRFTLVSSRPRDVKRKTGIALGVILGLGAVGAAIALGVVFGTPTPPPQFSRVTFP